MYKMPCKDSWIPDERAPRMCKNKACKIERVGEVMYCRPEECSYYRAKPTELEHNKNIAETFACICMLLWIGILIGLCIMPPTGDKELRLGMTVLMMFLWCLGQIGFAKGDIYELQMRINKLEGKE